MNIQEMLNRLSKSKFRNSFHLNQNMKNYVKEKGFDTIKSHTYDFINSNLRPKYIANDGKQTPMKQVHPTFIARHATATCCRECLKKWHSIPKDIELTDKQVDYIVDLIIKWIELEVNYKK